MFNVSIQQLCLNVAFTPLGSTDLVQSVPGQTVWQMLWRELGLVRCACISSFLLLVFLNVFLMFLAIELLFCLVSIIHSIGGEPARGVLSVEYLILTFYKCQ